jgi:cell division protein FtsQ
MPEKKVVSIEERIPKLREARKKKANRRLIFYLTLFFILILIILYLQSPLSHVKKIRVIGNNFVETEQIVNQSNLTKDQNIWNIDKKKIKEKVEKLTEIKSVKVDRKLPNTVVVSVEEYVRVGYVRNKGHFYPVLENGQALKNDPIQIPLGDAPILIGWDNSTYLTEMTNEISKLHEGISSLISEIHWSPEDKNPYKVRLFMNNGREVITSVRNFSDKMRAYPSIAAQIDPEQKGYINLDLGAFFVPYQDLQNDTEEGENESEVEG